MEKRVELACPSWEQRAAGTRREGASPPNPLEDAVARGSTSRALASSTVNGTWQLTPHVAGWCEPPETVGVSVKLLALCPLTTQQQREVCSPRMPAAQCRQT